MADAFVFMCDALLLCLLCYYLSKHTTMIMHVLRIVGILPARMQSPRAAAAAAALTFDHSPSQVPLCTEYVVIMWADCNPRASHTRQCVHLMFGAALPTGVGAEIGLPWQMSRSVHMQHSAMFGMSNQSLTRWFRVATEG